MTHQREARYAANVYSRPSIRGTDIPVWKGVHGVAPPYTGALHPSGKSQRSSIVTVCVYWMHEAASTWINAQPSSAFGGPAVWNSLPLAPRVNTLDHNQTLVVVDLLA